MKTPEKLQFLILAQSDSKRWVPVVSNDVVNTLVFHTAVGIIPVAEYRAAQLPGVSFQLNVRQSRALITVVRECDFIAEAVITCPESAVLMDLLGHDPTDSDTLRLRRETHEAVVDLQPPSCLMCWKDIAADRLSVDEHDSLVKEMEVLAGALVSLLMVDRDGVDDF